MKKFPCVLCTIALLLSFSACGVEKPDLEKESSKETASSSTSTSSTSEKENKGFEIKDSHITEDLTERFRIDADISGNDISKVSGLGLKITDLTEEQIADILLSDGRSGYDETESGEKIFNNNKEVLSILFNDSFPSLTYSLDKGKEYQYISEIIAFGFDEKDAGAENAKSLVKSMLDKLHIETDDLTARLVDHDEMNNIYSSMVDAQNKYSNAESVSEIEESEGFGVVITDRYFSSAYNGPANENFRFDVEDDCYFVGGNISFKGLPIKTSNYYDLPEIVAAVSSRGIEYLYLDNLYSSERSYGESDVIPVEQAVESVFEAAKKKSDELDITIDSIELSYLKDHSADSLSSIKYDLVPVWSFRYFGTNGERSLLSAYCHVSASDGHIMTPETELFCSVE